MALPAISDAAARERKNRESGQMSLFDFMGDEFAESVQVPYPDVEEYPDTEKLSLEKAVVGVYISGHPLEKFTDLMRRMCTAQSTEFVVEEEDGSDEAQEQLESEVQRLRDNEVYVVGGIITDVAVKLTKKNQNMAYVTIEDLYGQIEITVFPRDFERCRDKLLVDNRVFIKGRASIGEKENKLLLSELMTFEDAANGMEFAGRNTWTPKNKPEVKQSTKQLWVLFEDVMEYTKNESGFISILEEYKGSCPVYVQLKKTHQAKNMGRGFCVNENSGVVAALQMEYGKDRVLIRDVGPERR